ncbi:MAG: radical SAM protein [Candidatus Omnitrophota bacterium]
MILINAQNDRTEKLGLFSRYVPLSIPRGIAFLAAYLIEKRHEVKVWDDAIKQLGPDDVRELVKDMEKPYVFGVSCVTASITRGYSIAGMIRSIYPDAVVVFGGVHPTVLPEEALDTGLVDFVVRKEGEVPLEALLRALRKGEDPSGISNLSFKRNGKIMHNPAVPGPEFDSLPAFPYYLFEKHRDRYDFGFVVNSRGCPYDCIFCSQRSITGRRVTFGSPARAVSEIELLVNKYDNHLITFNDESLLTSKEHIRTMCELIRKRGLHKKASFQCQIRGDEVDESILKVLKATNFIAIFIGLETASERLMTLINKKETVKQNIEAMRLVKKHDFSLSGAMILGLPTETREERLQSYRMAEEHLDYGRFNNATPYPGTRLYEIAKKEGRLNIEKDWRNLNACGTLVEGIFRSNRLAYVPVGTSELELKKDIMKYNLFFSFKSKVIGKLLRQKSNTIGWFKMRPRWYYSPIEWVYLVRLGLRIIWLWIELGVITVLFYFRKGNSEK